IEKRRQDGQRLVSGGLAARERPIDDRPRVGLDDGLDFALADRRRHMVLEYALVGFHRTGADFRLQMRGEIAGPDIADDRLPRELVRSALLTRGNLWRLFSLALSLRSGWIN